MPGERRHHIASRRLAQDAERRQSHAQIVAQCRLVGIAGMDRMDPPAQVQRQFQSPGVVFRAAAAARGRMSADRKKNCNIKAHGGDL